VAEWIPDIFCSLYLLKDHKIANNPATAEAREKNTDLESLQFKKTFDVSLTRF